ncbi:MAG: hypothetical protein SPL49_03085 [Oribacterium sp.]|nr:hypothetical protein [Oribacterium sp.]MDY6309335.1 hypothetical protein [Oribacterium sp.]MDY6316184.1 hypothetical protein [Oribacterium sp.]
MKEALAHLLYTIRDRTKAVPKKILKEQIFCLAAALFLTVITYLSAMNSSNLIGGVHLLRDRHGGLKKDYEISVSGLSDQEIPLNITVSPIRYTKEEADQVFADILENIEGLITTENQSLASLSSDLNLPASLPDKGVRLSWDYYPDMDPMKSGEVTTTENMNYRLKYSDLIDESGKLDNEDLDPDTVVTGYLSLILSTDIVPEDPESLDISYHSEPYKIYVNVVGRDLTEEERLLRSLKNMILENDQSDIHTDRITLPDEIEGKRISYRESMDRTYLIFPLLGIVAAAALYLRQGAELKKEQKLRNDQLMLDYSELVSKLMVYIGAGLTIKNAFEKISEHYDSLIHRGILKERPLAVELRTMHNQFRRNMAESDVYNDFSRRINLKPYSKLVSLIEQNRKNGTKNLRVLLELEMNQAFEDRKTTARRLGEEAGTKLLLPLFMLLGIVMAIVIVPALTTLS